MKKSSWSTIIIVFGILIISVFILYRPTIDTPEEIAKCIGRESLIYTQLGCHACLIQEEMFGDSYKYLNKIDCFYEREKCLDIGATPTWIINGQRYEGVHSIEELQNLTGCE